MFSYSFLAAFGVIHRFPGFTDNSSATDSNCCLFDYSNIRVKFFLMPSLKALFLNTLCTWNTINLLGRGQRIQKLLQQSDSVLFREERHSVVFPPNKSAGLLSTPRPFIWTQICSHPLLKAGCPKQDAKFQSKFYQRLLEVKSYFMCLI